MPKELSWYNTPMTIVNGIVDWAIQVPGPEWKVWDDINANEGFALHSMEGDDPNLRFSRMMHPTDQASWMFSLMKDGRLFQHYSIDKSPWTSGSREANRRYWSIELEGKAGQPINDAQLATLKRLQNEYTQYTGKSMHRQGPGKNLWEHKEFKDIFGSAATACPSDRYDKFYETINPVPAPAPSPEIQQLKMQMVELNSAVMKRFDLLNLASGNYQTLLRAWDTLKLNGLL